MDNAVVENNETVLAGDNDTEESSSEESFSEDDSAGLITVTCGANVMPFGQVVGKSIRALRNDLKDVLNIPRDSKVMVSGEEVGESYTLQPGDRVEFIKESGDKG